MGLYLSLTRRVNKVNAKTRLALLAVPLFALNFFAACALAQDVAKEVAQNARQANAKDPWESFNRSMFRLNDQIDQNVTKPFAQAYVNVAPSLVRTGVRNFFGNISDVWSAANSALQFKPREATEGFMRVVINTTLGVCMV